MNEDMCSAVCEEPCGLETDSIRGAGDDVTQRGHERSVNNVTPMSEKLIFAQTFEGLLRSMGPRLTSELKQGMRERGFDCEQRLRPAYSIDVFCDVIEYLAASLYPTLPLDDGIAQLGRTFMDGFGETLIGRAMLGLLWVIGPVGSLKRVTQNFRTANNYSVTRLTQIGPRRYELWVNELRMPGWYVGIISRGLELAGAQRPRVSLDRKDPEQGGHFRVEWE